MAAIDGSAACGYGAAAGDAPQRVPLPAAAAPPDLPQGAEAEVQPVEPVEPAQPANDYDAEAGVVEDGCALVACGTDDHRHRQFRRRLLHGATARGRGHRRWRARARGAAEGGRYLNARTARAAHRVAAGSELDEGPSSSRWRRPKHRAFSDQFATFLRGGEADKRRSGV